MMIDDDDGTDSGDVFVTSNVTVELRLELFTNVYFLSGIFVELQHHDIDQVMVVDFSIVV